LARVTIAISAFAGSVAVACAVQEQKPAPNVSAAQAEFFEAKLRPLLVANCYSCHGPDKQLGGLRLDSRAAIGKGGGRGPAINSTTLDASLLLKAVSYSHSDLKMPPSGKLRDDQVALLGTWVKMGAPWPEETKGTKGTEGSEMWALRPIRKTRPPKVKNSAWIQNPIDAFILSKLE